MMTAYYNEIDPFAAAWLRELIRNGLIAPGFVDERSIEDVNPDELMGYTQCHFFAGIGVWSYALRLAGWPDDKPVWTGSCPCQPFSQAGKGAGFDDERHLWPAFEWLIRQCRPATIFGEQVAAKNADIWIDLVHADLEAMGYAFGCVPFPSAGIGAPHIRDRNFWLANTQLSTTARQRSVGSESLRLEDAEGSSGGRLVGSVEGNASNSGMLSEERITTDFERLANDNSKRCRKTRGCSIQSEFSQRTKCNCIHCRMADTEHAGHDRPRSRPSKPNTDGADSKLPNGSHIVSKEQPSASPTNGFWRDADWLFCRDGKWRPVEPGTFPLAHGSTARVGRLRGYGNAINAEAAKTFVEAAKEVIGE